MTKYPVTLLLIENHLNDKKKKQNKTHEHKKQETTPKTLV